MPTWPTPTHCEENTPGTWDSALGQAAAPGWRETRGRAAADFFEISFVTDSRLAFALRGYVSEIYTEMIGNGTKSSVVVVSHAFEPIALYGLYGGRAAAFSVFARCVNVR